MKTHTYHFVVRTPDNAFIPCSVEAEGKTIAYYVACADTRFKNHKVLKATFRREDTAKGANRAGGLDSNGKQIDARTAYEKAKEATCKDVKDRFEAAAYKDFLKHLNLAIESLYLCNFENNGAVLSMPIKELYEAMKEYDPFK
jgi:hypothetical protein